MLSKDWKQRKQKYDFIIIGSGYGGAITAARLTAATPSPSVCLLERGREWEVGKFPDDVGEVARSVRNPTFNPTGLYDFQLFPEISVMKGSGLGGTSLINANVAIVPDEEVFKQMAWPAGIKLPELLPFYQKAKQMLGANPHPRGNPAQADSLLKVRGLDKRAQELNQRAFPLDIVVSFKDGKNAAGVEQKACIDCGDCVTGCNVGAKNTLYMNYLPVAARQGCDIFTKTEIKWIEKLSGGGWRVHGVRYKDLNFTDDFTLDAGKVILAAGSLGTPEILLRSEFRGLSLSPKVGTQFSGNGDFFALAYNADQQLNTVGFGKNPGHKWAQRGNAPGPSIVGTVRYGGTNSSLPLEKRMTVQDFSFPSAYVSAAMIALDSLVNLGGGQDTDLGDEKAERDRVRKNNPFDPYKQDNAAFNHTMLYLIMGHDDGKGVLRLKHEQGRVEIDWDNAGRQQVFNLINEEIRRHSRALGATFVTNPLWAVTPSRNLITAHPLGGCPLGDDYLHGAVDEFGRVFAGDGNVHDGLFVADGSLISTALGVNPFLTISALSERIADRMVRHLGGEAYPARPVTVPVGGLEPAEITKYKEDDLERIFSRVQTGSIEKMVNGGKVEIDAAHGMIRNDTVWKGFFPRGHVMDRLSTAFFASFSKRFSKTADGKFIGVTSDSDGRINANNKLEEITLTKRAGTLDPGKYIKLTYTDPQWAGFYDIFNVVSDDLLIGRVYLGRYPDGHRLFTFPMVRSYGLDNMTVPDHQAIWEQGAVPAKEQLSGLWEMHMVSNAHNTGVVAYLKFEHKPDGRLESHYQFLGLIEGLADGSFGQDHFRMDDFTRFHDEIRFVNPDMLVGKYVTDERPAVFNLFGPDSLGLFHREKGADGTTRFGFYYWLKRSTLTETPAVGFLRPLLDTRLPEGVGMSFDEEMNGYFFPGFTPSPGRAGDQQIEARIPASGKPADGEEMSLEMRITARDLNEFIESTEHEARLEGTIRIQNFEGQPGQTICTINSSKSFFNYLRINPATQEAEILYRIYFFAGVGREYLFSGRKYMQKDARDVQEIVRDFTTCYGRLTELKTGREVGAGLLRFRTFEDPDAVHSFAEYLKSFRVIGTDNPFVQSQTQLRFLAVTNQFVAREYDLIGNLLS